MGSKVDEQKKRLDSMQQQNSSITNELIKKMVSENKMLNKIACVDEITTARIDAMNLDELKKLKQIVEDAEKELMENTLNCIACKENKKNVSFADGCDHFVLCNQCESNMETKQCPICSTAYTKTKRLNV